MKKVTFYKNVKDTTGRTVELSAVFDAIKTGDWGLKAHQENVRNAEGETRAELKDKTPSITPSGTFSKRSDSKLIEHSTFLNFDIDHVLNVDYIFDTVSGDEHTAAIWRSISGEGITGLFKVGSQLDKDSHKEAYKNMIAYFSELYGIDLDTQCQNVSRLRFLSFDPEIQVYPDSKIFEWKPEKKEEVLQPASRFLRDRSLNGSASYFDKYNAETDCFNLLRKYGWSYLHSKGGKIRVTRPGGSKGQLHGEIFEDNRFKCYTDKEGFGSKPVSPFDILMHYEFGGDFEAAKASIRPERSEGPRFEDIPFPTEEPEAPPTEKIVTESFEVEQKKRIKVKTLEEQEITLPTFPVDSLPKEYQNIIGAVSKAKDIPPDFLACAMMQAAATAIGHSIKLKLANDWEQSASLFMALVGDSAAGKSPAIDYAFNLIRKRDAELIAQYDKEAKQYEIDQMEKETRGGARPIKKEYVINKSTIESTMATLSANPYGAALLVDELAGWINAMNQYKSKGAGSEEKDWLTIFDNRDLKKSTITRGTSVIQAPYVPILGGIQPKILNQIAKDGRNYDGFMFRFLFCITEERDPLEWDDLVKSKVPSGINEAWEGIIENLFLVRDTIESNQIASKDMGLAKQEKYIYMPLKNDTDGGKLWGEWYNKNVAEIKKARKNGEDQKVSALTKLSIITSRLILLNEILLISQGDYHPEEISLGAVKSALSQSEYFKQTSFYAFSIIEEQSNERKVHRESKCDWFKIFQTQEEIDNGLKSSEIISRIMLIERKSRKTAKNWIKDLTKVPRLPNDDKRTQRYTI